MKMKIIIIGASGTIGKQVCSALEKAGEHKIIKVGNQTGDYRIDISSELPLG